MNIHQKILEVMKEVKTIEKNGRNDFHKYDYAQAQDVIYQVRESMIKHGLVLQTNTLEHEKHGDITVLKIEFVIVDVESGESVKSVTIGEGSDKGDKGAYKAYTGAMKYFLRDRFMLSFGEDPEKEESVRPERQNVRPMQKAAPQRRATQNQRVTGAQLLKEAKARKGVSDEDLKFIALGLLGKVKGLTDAQYAGIAQFIDAAKPEDLTKMIQAGKEKMEKAG
jgi:hypothetical protein